MISIRFFQKKANNDVYFERCKALTVQPMNTHADEKGASAICARKARMRREERRRGTSSSAAAAPHQGMMQQNRPTILIERSGDSLSAAVISCRCIS